MHCLGPVLGDRYLSFGEFQLDLEQRCLRCGGVDVPLRTKSFTLLRYLAEHRGRVVTREELLDAVWTRAAVSPGVVRTTIRELRKALGDDAAGSRFIETIGRKGYRFVAPQAAPVAEVGLVGRTAELAQLHARLARSRARGRQVVFVSGEPGIGKTTVVERFLQEVSAAGLAQISRGRCVNLHGPLEPYLPVLEILSRLCLDDREARVLGILERWAPTWLLQLPAFIDSDTAQALHGRVPNPTRERMMRELGDALDVLARDFPLVLMFEDLHWSDTSTTDLLTYLAERSTAACLLIVATYRPVDAIVSGHAIRAAVRALVARERAVEIALELLTLDDIGAYLSRTFIETPVDPTLAPVLHRRTGGHPLFLRASIEYLLDREILAIRDGCWQLGPGEDVIPPSVRELVLREIEALSDDDRRILSAASVVGVEFDARIVAAACNLPIDVVEERCAQLSARRQLVRAPGTASWADRSTANTYSFRHALHRDVTYHRLPSAERVRLHRAVGERIEHGRVTDSGLAMSALATHFECGEDWDKAVQYHSAAAGAAKRRFADHEVAMHCEAVLKLLPHLPPSEERDRLEMVCSLDLSTSRIVAQGHSPAELRPLVLRARDLSVKLGLIQVEVLARFSLLLFEMLGGDQRQALVLSREVVGLAERFPVPAFVVMGQMTLGGVYYNLGNLIEARRHLQEARNAWQPDPFSMRFDSRMMLLGGGAMVLQQMGETAKADAWINELVEHTRGLEEPLAVASACRAVSQYRLWAGDRTDALAWADRGIPFALEHGLPAVVAMANRQKGHAGGDVDLQRETIAFLKSIGYRLEMPLCHFGLGETLFEQERYDEARDELNRAIEAADATGEVRHLAEVYRVLGACARAQGRLQGAAEYLEKAVAAAARARAGAQIVDLTYRDRPPGIDKIDRTTVPELHTVCRRSRSDDCSDRVPALRRCGQSWRPRPGCGAGVG